MKLNGLVDVAVASRSFSKNIKLRKELLKIFKNVRFNDSGKILSGSELINFLSGAKRAIIGLEKIDKSILLNLKDLKVISKYGVGLDSIDQEALKDFGIKLGWTSGVNKRSVSELVIMLILMSVRNYQLCCQNILEKKWIPVEGGLLTGKTIGIIGLGNVGKDLVQLLQPWNCKILAYDLIHDLDFNQKYNINSVKLNVLLQKSDIISLHVPLDSTTFHLLNSENINYIKSGATIINTSRGGVIDENALMKIIEKKDIRIALDVLESEPDIPVDYIYNSRITITPHVGGSGREAILAMGMSAIKNLQI